MKFIDLAVQQALIKEQIDSAIQRVLVHGKYIQGPEVGELEERLADFVGVKHCITCANGTDALQIALMAIGVGAGDEVIMPAFTYIATAETVVLLGAKPIYVDIDLDTCLLNIESVEKAVTGKTKAIIPVSLYGQCSDFLALNQLSEKYNIPIIEDAAQSFGARRNGYRSCSQTTIACTSFFPSKPLGCYGDGGAIFTSDPELAKVLRQIANHGQKERYNHVRIGVNSRLDTLQAAILLAKLPLLDAEILKREELANIYNESFSDLSSVNLLKIESPNKSAWAQYTIRVENRKQFEGKLRDEGIPYAIHYPKAVHQQLATKDMTCNAKNAEKAASEVISLPFHAYLDRESVERVISAVSFFG
jgi:UDP-2-acetamido-2-deoxy-ribo-hexuluronate aminotransferase